MSKKTRDQLKEELCSVVADINAVIDAVVYAAQVEACREDSDIGRRRLSDGLHRVYSAKFEMGLALNVLKGEWA